MRRLPTRPSLSRPTIRTLTQKARKISQHASPKDEAERIYTNARKSKWFKPVIAALKALAGRGGRCMFCSGSECSQLEHYKPKAVFPNEAMNWLNFIWVCGICNQNKGNRFPAGAAERIINPLDEDVWEHFFIDEFGNLTGRWSIPLGAIDPRAESTIAILGLDRDALQQSRQSRLSDLKQRVADTSTMLDLNQIAIPDARNRVTEWLSQPFQPDVAQYFLEGPGRNEQPFAAFLGRL